MAYESPLDGVFLFSQEKLINRIEEEKETKLFYDLCIQLDIPNKELTRQELLKALVYDRDQYNKGHYDGYREGYEKGYSDAVDYIFSQSKLMKEGNQNEEST